MSYCEQFHLTPNVNPRTGKSITVGGPTYRELVKLCGIPPGPIPAYLEESVRGLVPSVREQVEGESEALIILRGPYHNELYIIPIRKETYELLSDLQGINDGTFYIGSEALRGILSPFYQGPARKIIGPFEMLINLEPKA